jgi:hypothetical protein
MTKLKKIISVFIIAFSIPLTVYFVIVGIKYFSRAALTPATLSFSQNPINLNPTTATAVNLVLNANAGQVGFAQVQFTFDKTKVMMASEIVPSTSLKKVITQTTAANANSTGQVTLVIALDPADISNPPTGAFNLGQLSFKAVNATASTSTIAFTTANTQIIDMTANAFTLTTTNATANVLGNATATPTSVPTASPTTAPTHTPTPSPTAVPTSTATAAPTGTGAATATPTAVPTASPSPTPTQIASATPTNVAATATPTATPLAAINFSLKLQGLNRQGQNKTVAVLVKNGATTVYNNNSVSVTSNSSGVYSGSITGVNPGTYDIYIKEANHLQKKFTSLALAAGSNNLNWTTSPLKAGDFNSDNKITIADIALILAQYQALSVPVNNNNRTYDINGDDVINIIDVSLVLSNYIALTVSGD